MQANETSEPVSAKETLREIEQLNPNALFFEPRERNGKPCLDAAILGYTTSPANRSNVLVYDRDKLIEALSEMFFETMLADASTDLEAGETIEDYDLGVLEDDVEDAVAEWLSYNLEASEMGEHTPIVIKLNN
jgi:hypothetical protein